MKLRELQKLTLFASSSLAHVTLFFFFKFISSSLSSVYVVIVIFAERRNREWPARAEC